MLCSCHLRISCAVLVSLADKLPLVCGEGNQVLDTVLCRTLSCSVLFHVLVPCACTMCLSHVLVPCTCPMCLYHVLEGNTDAEVSCISSDVLGWLLAPSHLVYFFKRSMFRPCAAPATSMQRGPPVLATWILYDLAVPVGPALI